LIGEEATGAAWIVMQHASIERQKRFLPLLRQAVAANRALPPIEEYLRRAEGELGAQIDRSALDAD
jgi:hypothetical protein